MSRRSFEHAVAPLMDRALTLGICSIWTGFADQLSSLAWTKG